MNGDDRAVLDRVCALAAQHTFIKAVPRRHGQLRASINRLRYRGLIQLQGWRPSPSAMADWREREAEKVHPANADSPPVEIESAGQPGGIGPLPAPAEAVEEREVVPTASSPSAATKKGCRWPADHDAAMKIAFDRGISAADLAVALQRNYYTVCRVALNRGLKFGVRPRLSIQPTLSDILAWSDSKVAIPPFAKRPSPKNVRQKEIWADDRQQAFLKALERSGGIDAACIAAGLKPSSKMAAYRQRHRNPSFAASWDEAIKAGKETTQAVPELTKKRSTKAKVLPPAPPPPPPAPPPAPPTPAPAPRRPGRVVRDNVFTAAPRAPAGPMLPTTPSKSDAAISAESLRFVEERKKIAALTSPAVNVDEAKLFLQRRGLNVYRASVIGGLGVHWVVAGKGNDITDSQLIELAKSKGFGA